MGDLLIFVYLIFLSSRLTDVIAKNAVRVQDIATSTTDDISAKLDSVTKRQSSLETRLLARIGKGMRNCNRCGDSDGNSDDIINNIKNDLNSTIDSLQQKMTAIEMNSEAMKNKVDRMNTSLSELKQASEDRISFYAFLEPTVEGVYFDVSKFSKIPFNHVTINDGSGYNNTTAIFTTPKSGVYQITFFVEAWTKNDDFNCEAAVVGLVINKTIVMTAVAEPRHSKQSIMSGNTYITYVDKGQNIWVQTLGNCESYSIFGYRTSFSGVLLY